MVAITRIGYPVSGWAGCDSPVEVEMAPIDKLYAVSSIISPQDTSFLLYLFKAREPGAGTGQDLAAVDNALVVISDVEGNSDTLIYGDKHGKYAGKVNHVNVAANEMYFLRVEIPSGLVLTSYCIILPNPGELIVDGRKEADDYYFTARWKNESAYKYFILSLDAQGTIGYNAPSGPLTLNITPLLLDDIIFPLSIQGTHNSIDGFLPYVNISLGSDPLVSVWSDPLISVIV